MNIKDILLIVIIIYLVILHCKSKRNNREHFAVTDDIRAAVKEIYNTDMEAVRQLATMATKLTAGGLEIPGNLIVTGTIKAAGEIYNNSYSLSGLSSSISSTNSNLSSSINSINSNLSSNLSYYVSSLQSQINSIDSNKFDKSGGTISGNVNINGHLTGTNFTMNTGSGWAINTVGNSGQFVTQNGVYFGAGAYHGNGGYFGSRGWFS
jgi:hypothetical protein